MKVKKPLEIIIEYLKANKGRRIQKREIIKELPEYGRNLTGVAYSPMKYDRIFGILAADKITLTNANLSIKEISYGTREKTFLIGEA